MRILQLLFCILALGCYCVGCRSSLAVPEPQQPTYEIHESVDDFAAVSERELVQTRKLLPVASSQLSHPPMAQWSDRPGYVESPFGDRGWIDVRGFAPGSEVRDPKSGRTFLIPLEKP